MADITVTANARNPCEFDVQVAAGRQHTSHRVTVPENLSGRFVGASLETLVRTSFEFLLEREPATSILSEFSLSVISSYFPEYPDELASRLT